MSAIPPNWMASVIQSHGAQGRADEAKKKEISEESERAGKADFSENLQNVIKESDQDSEVYADAEGTGSEGRPSSEEALDAEELEEEQESGENDAGGALDIEA